VRPFAENGAGLADCGEIRRESPQNQNPQEHTLKNTSDLSTLSRELFAGVLRARFSKSVCPELLALISDSELLSLYDRHKHGVLRSIRARANAKSEGLIENTESLARR
jgi:hypothetical protein